MTALLGLVGVSCLWSLLCFSAQPETKEVEGKEDAEETAETAEEAVPLAKEKAEIEEKAEAEK